jgi:hypothetical protein
MVMALGGRWKGTKTASFLLLFCSLGWITGEGCKVVK